MLSRVSILSASCLVTSRASVKSCAVQRSAPRMSFRKLKTAASGTFGIASKVGAVSETDAVLLRRVFAMVNRIHETAVFPNMVLAEWDCFEFIPLKEQTLPLAHGS